MHKDVVLIDNCAFVVRSSAVTFDDVGSGSCDEVHPAPSTVAACVAMAVVQSEFYDSAMTH